MTAIPQRSSLGLPSDAPLPLASPGLRLGALALDYAIALVTLWVGWLIWFAVIARRGQTPGKQLLSLRLVRWDGRPTGTARTLLRELALKWAFLWLPYAVLLIVVIAEDLFKFER